ncbi:hypothetical protein B0O99DRAFT_596848 [Bisporella sp. PMI_857]|nr:hypothetical protein B0O99DRAFT_596848 [Bisporella sp. PMI_857]
MSISTIRVTFISELHHLMDIIRELVMAESPLHEPSAPICTGHPGIGIWRTPLLTLLDAFFFYCSEVNHYNFNRPKYQRFNVEQPLCVLEWLHHLKACGKNLVEYGTDEQVLHPAYRFRIQRLLGFTFGPEPEDWKFYFTEEMDSSFVEFWDMIDHPERGMPGTWNSYNPDDYLDDVYRMEELPWGPWGPWDCFYDGDIPKAYEETFGRKFLHPEFGAMFDEETGKWTTTI